MSLYKACYLGNNLHQQITQLIVTFPIQWSSAEMQWFLSTPPTEIHSYYKTACFIKLGIIFIYVVSYIHLLYHYKIIPTLFFEISIACIVGSIGTLSLDFFCCFYQTSVIQVFNWSYSKESRWLRSYKFGSTLYLNTTNLFELLLVLGITFLTVVTSVALSYGEIDPLFIISISSLTNYPCLQVLTTLARIIIRVYIGLHWSIILRLFAIFSFRECACRFALLKKLTNLNFRIFSVRLYQEIIIVTNITNSLEKPVTAVILGNCTVIFSAAAFFLACKQENTIVMLLSGSIFLSYVMLLQLTFMGGCKIFKQSTKLLRKWKKLLRANSKRTKYGDYLERVVTSLRIVSLPAAYFGVIDMDIKINYLDKLLDCLMTVLITLNQI